MKEYFENWSEMIIPWLMNHGVKIVFILVGGYILNKVAAHFIEKAVRIAVVSDQFSSKDAERKREDTLIQIFRLTSRIVIIAIAILMVLQEFGVMIGPILAAAGIVGLAFGFGGQYLIRDVITGLFILIENQYRIGDVVNIDGIGGLVENISLRMTTLRDLDGTVHHIPHGEIKKVSNMAKVFARINLNIGVAYDSDIEHVIRVINETGMDMAKDESLKELIIKPPQFLRVDELADSAIVFKVTGDVQPLKQWELTGELRRRIIHAFNREKIVIPFPQRTVHHRNETE